MICLASVSEAEELGRQHEPQAHAVAAGIDSRGALSLGLEEAPVLVEPQGTQRHAELAGEVADAEAVLDLARSLGAAAQKGFNAQTGFCFVVRIVRLRMFHDVSLITRP
jgi:hypothetical protein